MPLRLDLHCEKNIYWENTHCTEQQSCLSEKILILWKDLPSKPMAQWLEGDIFPSAAACVVERTSAVLSVGSIKVFYGF